MFALLRPRARAMFALLSLLASALGLQGSHRRAPRRGPGPLAVKESTDMDALLRSVVGAGTGMGARRRGKGSHVNKYRKAAEDAEDPWAAAVAGRARRGATPTAARELRCAACFAEGAALARARPKSGAAPGAVLDFDARDPSTFGFAELGTVVGADGVRGGLRVDCYEGDGAALLSPGLRHLRLASRRSPRPVVVAAARELKRLGAKTIVVELAGLTREAAALRGATLYARDVDAAFERGGPPPEDDAYAPSKRLLGLRCVDAETGNDVGAVFDVLDPNEGQRLAHSLLEIELAADPTLHCLVPLAPECLPDVGADVVTVAAPPGLLDLAFKYEPPPPIIKGLLEPPAGV
ncbi:UTP-glucose-1-phosphate uridylyltransferase [Aureococcus anophagefferens]|nr:UTP-glucose-1-phosphate uridylyltransferase [Aureococcus anophagefferens]